MVFALLFTFWCGWVVGFVAGDDNVSVPTTLAGAFTIGVFLYYAGLGAGAW